MPKYKDKVLADLDKRRKKAGRKGMTWDEYKKFAIEKFGKRTGALVYKRAVEMEFSEKKKEEEKKKPKESHRDRTKRHEFIENIK